MSMKIDGFYIAYLSGKNGQGLAMLVFREGRIVGADAGEVIYDGQYAESPDGTIPVTLSLKFPPNASLIQGGTADPKGEEAQVNFRMPPDFSSGKFFRVETPRGPVNARLLRLRGLDG
jgi:hypothetical protein